METGKDVYKQGDLVDGLKIMNDDEGTPQPAEDKKPPDGTPPPPDGTPPPAEDKKPPDGIPPEKTEQEKFLSEIFGDRFKSIDEVKSFQVNERLNEYDNLKQIASKLTDENKLLSTQVESFNDENVQKILRFSKFAKETGIDDYALYNRLLTSEMKDLDDVKAIALSEIIESPEKMSKALQIEERIRRKYKQGIYADDDPDNEGEKLPNADLDLDLEMDGAKARKKLNELKSKISSLGVDNKDFKKEREEYLANWTQLVPKMLEHYKGLKGPEIKIPGDFDANGKPTEIVIDNVNYVITDSDKKVIGEMITNHIKSNHIPLTPENVVSVYQNTLLAFQAIKFKELATMIANESRQRTIKELAVKYNNPTLTKDKVPPAEGKIKRHSPDSLTPSEYVAKETA